MKETTEEICEDTTTIAEFLRLVVGGNIHPATREEALAQIEQAIEKAGRRKTAIVLLMLIRANK